MRPPDEAVAFAPVWPPDGSTGAGADAGFGVTGVRRERGFFLDEGGFLVEAGFVRGRLFFAAFGFFAVFLTGLALRVGAFFRAAAFPRAEARAFECAFFFAIGDTPSVWKRGRAPEVREPE